MAAGRYSFIIEQGATIDFEIEYQDSNGSPIDLSEYQARMELRPSPSPSSETYITLSSSLQPDGTGLNLRGSSGTLPYSSGSIGIYISAYSSSLLTFDECFYDLELATIEQYPTVIRLLEGKVKLSKNTTWGPNY